MTPALPFCSKSGGLVARSDDTVAGSGGLTWGRRTGGSHILTCWLLPAGLGTAENEQSGLGRRGVRPRGLESGRWTLESLENGRRAVDVGVAISVSAFSLVMILIN